ncbi:MAG: outer membrane protein [Rhodomicrobium sp.]
MTKLHRELSGFLLLSTIALAPVAAHAADLYRSSPPPPSYAPPAAYVDSYSWAGFYAGINGGYGWSDGGNSIGYNDGDQSSRAQPQGGFGGGQIGYNFQSGSFVYGVETDFQGGDLSDRVTGLTANGNDFSSRESVDWFGTVRGRLGYAFGRTLIYGTGGFAYGDVRQHAFVTDGTDSVSLRNSGVQTGYTAGGGIEYKITPAWSLKGEYQYIDLGSEKLSGFDNGNTAVTSSGLDTSFSTVKIGLNYRFGGGAEPLK